MVELAAEDQAADRAYRIGQDKPVMVYRIVTTDSIEERVLRLQDEKRRLVGDLALEVWLKPCRLVTSKNSSSLPSTPGLRTFFCLRPASVF